MNPRDEFALHDAALAHLASLHDEARASRHSRVVRWRSLLAVGLHALADRLAPEDARVRPTVLPVRGKAA